MHKKSSIYRDTCTNQRNKVNKENYHPFCLKFSTSFFPKLDKCYSTSTDISSMAYNWKTPKNAQVHFFRTPVALT